MENEYKVYVWNQVWCISDYYPGVAYGVGETKEQAIQQIVTVCCGRLKGEMDSELKSKEPNIISSLPFGDYVPGGG